MSVTIFLHGLESSSRGTKGRFFRERYPEMLLPDFKGSLPERMEKLNRLLSGRSGIRIVGSSFGGLMGALFAMENEALVDRLILLAPAINLVQFTEYKDRKVSVTGRLYHGKNDEVIPLEEVKKVAKRSFPNLSFHEVDDDHFLHKTFPAIDWDDLLLT